MLKKTAKPVIRVLALATLMLVALPMAGFSAAPPSDMDIKYGVNYILNPYDNVVAYVEDGNVILIGEVATADQKNAASNMSMGIPGVTAVENLLVIVGYDQAKKASLESRSDSAISTQVKNNLIAMPGVDYMNINVRASDDVVYLTGVVDNADEIKMAIGAAKSVPGVRKVENLIILRQ